MSSEFGNWPYWSRNSPVPMSFSPPGFLYLVPRQRDEMHCFHGFSAFSIGEFSSETKVESCGAVD